MLITNENQYTAVWNKVYEKLKFHPDSSYRGHSLNVKLPFKINKPYIIYNIEDITDAQVDLSSKVIPEIFAKITPESKKIYALDWQHSTFLYDPHNIEEQKDVFMENDGYYAYFPSYIPDGDYSFFISEDFSFGYLGHPWRNEIWIFGEELIKETEKIYKTLGWKKL